MTHQQWVAEANCRLRREPGYKVGMRFVTVKQEERQLAGATSWYDPARDGVSDGMFDRISTAMRAAHPLIDE